MRASMPRRPRRKWRSGCGGSRWCVGLVGHRGRRRRWQRHDRCRRPQRPARRVGCVRLNDASRPPSLYETIHSEGADESEQKRRTRRSRPAASCERSDYGCPMSRGVNEVNTESHRNRGRLRVPWMHDGRSDFGLTSHVIRSDGCRSHCVRSTDIGHPYLSRSPLRQRRMTATRQ